MLTRVAREIGGRERVAATQCDSAWRMYSRKAQLAVSWVDLHAVCCACSLPCLACPARFSSLSDGPRSWCLLITHHDATLFMNMGFNM